MLAAGFLGGASDEQPCVETTPELLERPGAPGTPTRIEAGVLLVDLFAIDDAAQTFEADVLLTLRWNDPRLAVGLTPASAESCSYAAEEVWNPRPLLLNERDVKADLQGLVRVQADGACSLSQRYSGTFSFRSDLRDFPLDDQDLTVGVVVPPRVGEVELVASAELSGLWEDVSIPNWRVEGSGFRTYEKSLPQIREGVNVFEFSLRVVRHHSYYVWKLIVPLVIVVIMSWSVFWISPTAAVQLGLGATSVLTLIAYRFATATLLPPIAYLTRLDHFLTGSSLLVLLALIESLVTVALGDAGKVATALRIDRSCRVAIPLAFVAVVAWSFWL